MLSKEFRALAYLVAWMTVAVIAVNMFG